MPVTGPQVLITTWNEERNLPDCLASVRGWARRILVVDSHSTDRTERIARAAGADFVQRAYRSPADQKNWGLAQLDPGWVLILDADERVGPALRAEIDATLAAPAAAAYLVPRRSRFLGREIRHAGWERDGVLRLLERDAGRYREALVHEEMHCPAGYGRLRAALEHDSYRDIDDYLERMLRYAKSGARQLRREGKRAGLDRVLLRPPARFLRMVVWQQGWRDGPHGLLLCALSALQVGLKHALHWGMARGVIAEKENDD
jgi:glycosyltransferase involved in cell wall biosynthesis